MPVYVNGRFLTQRPTGTQRMARELMAQLDAGDRSDIRILAPAGTSVPAYRRLASRSGGPFAGQIWEQTTLPWQARDGLLVNLCNLAPVAHPRNLVIIHDAAVYDRPQGYGLRFRAWYRTVLPIVGRRARRVLTVSQFSADRLVALGIARRDAVQVIPPGIDHMQRIVADPGALARFGLETKRYALVVGSANPNKNVAAAVAAIRSSGADLVPVVVGGAPQKAVFGSAGPDLQAGDVVDCGAVDDPTLRALYEHAVCLVFPSYYEGFGSPPVEAMAMGCPVVASNRASIPEVCGHAALLVDPDDRHEIATAIGRLARTPCLRAEMIARGRERAALYTWARSGEVLAGAIDDLT